MLVVLLKALLLIIVGLLNIAVGALVLQRNARKLVNLAFFLLTISLGGWVIGIAGFLLSEPPETAMLWAKAYYAFPLGIGCALVLFARAFPDERRLPRRWVIPTVGGLLIVLLPLLLSGNFLTTGIAYHDWGKEVVLNKAHYLTYSVYLLLCFGVGLTRIFIVSRRRLGLYASQAELFFYGFFVSSCFGVFFNLFLPWAGNYRQIHLGPLFTNFFIFAAAYSIIKRRMFDVSVLVARGAGYLATLLAVATAYGFVVFGTASYAFNLHYPVRLQMALSGATGVAALCFPYLKRNFDKLTNRLFYQDAYDPQAFLDQLNKVLVSTIEIESLLQRSAGVIGSTFKSTYCLFGIKEVNGQPQRIIGNVEMDFDGVDIKTVRKLTPKMSMKVVVTDDLDDSYRELRDVLRKNDVAVLARLTDTSQGDKEGFGYLVLGRKRSGNLYSGGDIKMISIVADELTIAIQNALRVEEIKNFNETLQQKVDVATRKLRQTNEKLKALDETKDEFISMASHQLRTPLTSVKGYVSMVLEGDAGSINDMQRKLLGQAFVSSQRMVFLIADLLNVSRLRTGKFVIEAKPTNLAEVVQEEVTQLVDTAASRDLKLTFQKPANFPYLMIDETKVRQVVMNFIDNAIYYTPAGGSIEVTLTEQASSIEFRVTDNGIGVPKAEQHHLFTKFYRANNAKKARPDGTGLGLFMAKKVIAAQGGAILFRSSEDKGSMFGFSFPKAKLLTQLGATPQTIQATEVADKAK